MLLLFVIGLTQRHRPAVASAGRDTPCPASAGRLASNASGSASAASSRRWYSARGTSTAPSETSSGVAHCTSSSAGRPRAQQLDEPEQRRLRGVGARVEHRLGREEATARDAVEPAGEALGVPRLDRVRPAELVQPRVGDDEVVIDPAVRPRAGRRTRGSPRRSGVDAGSRSRGAARRSERDALKLSSGTIPRGSGDHQTSVPCNASGRCPCGRRPAACPVRGRRRAPRHRMGGRPEGARSPRWWEEARGACLYT